MGSFGVTKPWPTRLIPTTRPLRLPYNRISLFGRIAMTSEPSTSDSLPLAEPSPAAGSAHILHGAQRYEVLAAVMVVMFFSSMAQTVVSTALPNIISDLHGISLYAWVFTAFILASAIVIPVYGKLSDIFGRKPLFFVAFALYIAGNVLAGFARNMETLVAARAISGLGAGGLQA